MKRCIATISLIIALLTSGALRAQLNDATKQLARDIFKQLVEINTTDSVGSTTIAAQAMAKRLLDAGFPASDVQVLGPNDRKGNMVARHSRHGREETHPVHLPSGRGGSAPRRTGPWIRSS